MVPRVEYARAPDGVTIAYSIIGAGPALVLLPAVPFSNFREEWRVVPMRAAFERLAARFRVIQYDGRGTGHSQREVTDFSLAAMVSDLGAVLDQAGVRQAGLLGFFNSCPHALAFAAQSPDRVTRLALYGGVARGWLPMSGDETQALLSLIERNWPLFAETAAHLWLGWSAGDAGPATAEYLRTAVTPAVARATLQAASGIDTTALLPQVPHPTLLAWKRGLRQLSEASVRELAGRLEQGRFVELPGDAPALFVEGGETVVDVLTQFFEEGDGSEGTQEQTPRRSTIGGSEFGLTARESEVLRLIATGDSNAQIAHRLGVSVHTVERHAANLYRKIEARGRADATAWAIRNGIG